VSGRAFLGHPAFGSRDVDVEHIRDAWRDACHDAHAAYVAWCGAAPADAEDRYVAFCAAADREAAAAEFLRRRLGV
jgi:hypothetical protein